MFQEFRADAAFDVLQGQADRLKELAGYKAIYLSYSKQLDRYRLTFDHWIVSPTRQATPVFQDRDFTAIELGDLLQSRIGFLELEHRLAEEDEACQRYRSESSPDFRDLMAARGDQAFINELVAQTKL